ncbi:MAG: formyltransferase family protein [Thiotrichaceae bacterium]
MLKSITKKQRVVFCTYSSIYSSQVLKILLQSEAIEIVGIVNSTRLLKPSFNGFTGSLNFIRKTGWRYSTYLFLVTDLFALLQPFSRLKTVHTLAKKNNIPLLDTLDINRDSGIQFINSLTPDILLSAHFNQLFKEPVLRLPKLTAINLHPSLLPNYKGVDPVFYALLNSEKQLGITAHVIDDSFDTGLILRQQPFTANTSNCVFSHNMQLFEMGAEIAIQAIHDLSLNKNHGEPQSGGNYDSWPDKHLVIKLRKQSKYLIKIARYLKALR